MTSYSATHLSKLRGLTTIDEDRLNHVIVFLELLAKLNDKKYIDGGLTDWRPVIDKNTIQVIPYMWHFLWGKTWFMNCLYGSTSDKRNSRLYNDGYEAARKNDHHWKRLDRFRKVPRASL